MELNGFPYVNAKGNSTVSHCIYVDGVIVKAKEYLWIVKGCHHEENRIIALPRYRLDGVKIKELAKSLEIARRYGFLVFNENLDALVPALPLDEIEYCLNPFNTSTLNLDDIGGTAWELKILLAREAGISLDSIGVTGSLLAKTVIPSIEAGDIDIVVRGTRESEKAYRALRRLREKGILSSVNSPVYRELEVQDEKTRHTLMKKRLLEGLYKNTPYSIRLIPCRKQQAITGRIKRLGWWEGVLEIIEHIQPYIMPYHYKIRVIRTNNPYKPTSLISYRMRFSELPLGLRLYVRGILEYHVGEGELKICPDHPGSKTLIQETTI